MSKKPSKRIFPLYCHPFITRLNNHYILVDINTRLRQFWILTRCYPQSHIVAHKSVLFVSSTQAMDIHTAVDNLPESSMSHYPQPACISLSQNQRPEDE